MADTKAQKYLMALERQRKSQERRGGYRAPDDVVAARQKKLAAKLAAGERIPRGSGSRMPRPNTSADKTFPAATPKSAPTPSKGKPTPKGGITPAMIAKQREIDRKKQQPKKR
jgi:hypothetical protein